MKQIPFVLIFFLTSGCLETPPPQESPTDHNIPMENKEELSKKELQDILDHLLRLDFDVLCRHTGDGCHEEGDDWYDSYPSSALGTPLENDPRVRQVQVQCQPEDATSPCASAPLRQVDPEPKGPCRREIWEKVDKGIRLLNVSFRAPTDPECTEPWLEISISSTQTVYGYKGQDSQSKNTITNTAILWTTNPPPLPPNKSSTEGIYIARDIQYMAIAHRALY